MLAQTSNQTQTDQPQKIEAPIAIRREWEKAAEGVNLLEITGSIGLLLVDITAALDFSQAESKLILGDLLFAVSQEI